MQKNLLVLNSSINIKKPKLKSENIKIEYKNDRIASYIKGFSSLQKCDIYKHFNKVVLIDNTYSNFKEINDEILNLLPRNINFLLGKYNKIGRKNKGAGMLDSLQRNKEYFKDYDFIFYFEPRLILKNPIFITDSLFQEKNVFTLESNKRVRTGYFGSNSKDLINFLNSYRPIDLVNENLHIELLMYEFYCDKNTLFLNKHISLWKNYLSNQYENY